MAVSGRFTVYMAISNDGGVLFDLGHNRLLKLNRVGVEMWVALAAGTAPSELVEAIARKYAVDRIVVAGDLRDLIARAAELGIAPGPFQLIESRNDCQPANKPSLPWYSQDDKSRPQPKRFQLFAAFVGLVLFDLVLTLASMERLCSVVAGWPVRRRDRQHEVTAQICSAVIQACSWYPKKSLCLQRSAVTACLLRSSGIAAQMVIGVRSMPFMAHAWVEANDAVVNDRPLVKRLYTVLATF